MSVKAAKKLLVIEDDPGLQSQLRWCFEGYEVIVAGDRESAITELRRHEPPVVTLDLGLPPDPANASEGLRLLEQLLKLMPYTKVIVVTGNEDRNNALEAIRLGAYDFYQKPIDGDVLSLIVNRAHQLYQLENENRRLAQGQIASPLEGIVAVSPEMLRVCRTVEKIAPTDATVLLLGESGTGKEVLARALHDLSSRGKERFVAINCAAIPETLLESELFGYEKGAFTGANKQSKGKIEYADGGTLFLDEVGDLPTALQAKLLRFLQERVIERLGGRSEIPVDVRIVCATHQDLMQLIHEARFREDLYYRISEITLNIPPLREREGDAIVIASKFLHHYAKTSNRAIRSFSKEAELAVAAYKWPGNVRELDNRVKRAVIMADGAQVTADDLELTVPETGDGRDRHLPNLRQAREQAERTVIARVMGMVEGNMSRAAELLGITRPTLYALLEKYKMRLEKKSANHDDESKENSRPADAAQ